MDNLKTIYHKLDAIENALYKLCALIGAIAMGIAFCAIFLQVLYRYILCNFVNLPFAFTEELARYCLFWIIYLLLPSVMKSGMEAANTFLPSLLKGKAKTVLYLIVRGICTLIAVIAFSSIVRLRRWKPIGDSLLRSWRCRASSCMGPS